MPAQVTPEVCWKPLRYKRDRWTDPATGIVVEKNIDRNIAQRRHILALCKDSESMQRLFRAACRDSFLVYCNLFLLTFHQVAHTAQGRTMERGSKHFPFITWPVQDDAVTELIASTGLTGQPAETMILDKSREMGATWLCLAAMVWLWTFHKDVSMLMCADRGDAVDSTGRMELDVDTSGVVPGSPDTLFWKIDYMLANVPRWMRPRFMRTQMHLQNVDNGSVLDGSTTRDNLGRGGRRALVLVDEASAIKNLRSIDESTQDTAACRWFNATPRGAHYFSELRSGGKSKVIVLGWWDHPEKGCDGPNGEPGRYIEHDEEKGEEVITGWWREKEKKRRQSMQDVAQNIDIDHLGAGKVVFDLGVLNRHLATYCRPPDHILSIDHTKDGKDRDLSIRAKKWQEVLLHRERPGDSIQGKLLWWGNLKFDKDRRAARPDQQHTYILAADVSGGNGASNSVIAILDRNLRTKVGEYVSASISPDGLARVMAMLGLWCGGVRGYGYLIWEANGPGGRVTRVLTRFLNYPWLHKRSITDESFDVTQDKLGWWNSQQTLRDGAEGLRGAYAAGEFIDPSELAVQEAMKWVRYDGGSIGPGPLEFESIEARATHGDRVIANLQLVVASAIDLPAPRGRRVPHDPGTGDLPPELLGEEEAPDLDAEEEFID